MSQLRCGAGAVLVVVASVSACGRSTHVDRPSASASTSPTLAADGSAAGTDVTIGSSTADLTAAIDGVDGDLRDSDTELDSANQGLSQDEGDPTK
jgi:hypothetical protein